MSEIKENASVEKNRKTRVGIVVSTKMEKTITVAVETRVPHPKFGKIIRQTSKFYVHDEAGKAAEGDRVRIGEVRPISKNKCWELMEILNH